MKSNTNDNSNLPKDVEQQFDEMDDVFDQLEKEIEAEAEARKAQPFNPVAKEEDLDNKSDPSQRLNEQDSTCPTVESLPDDVKKQAHTEYTELAGIGNMAVDKPVMEDEQIDWLQHDIDELTKELGYERHTTYKNCFLPAYYSLDEKKKPIDAKLRLPTRAFPKVGFDQSAMTDPKLIKLGVLEAKNAGFKKLYLTPHPVAAQRLNDEFFKNAIESAMKAGYEPDQIKVPPQYREIKAEIVKSNDSAPIISFDDEYQKRMAQKPIEAKPDDETKNTKTNRNRPSA